MKKFILLFLLSFLFLNSSIAQKNKSAKLSIKRALVLSNETRDLVEAGQTQKAVANSLELFRYYPALFTNILHKALSWHVQNDKKHYTLEYFEQLKQKNNKEINKIISPITLWNRAIITKDKQKLLTIAKALQNLLLKGTNYDARTSRYCLLILKQLDKKKAIIKSFRKELILQNIANLETFPFNKLATNRKEREKRTWYRYMLSNSYYYLYSNVLPKEEYIKKAADYSPDFNDKANINSYFYDATLLTGSFKNLGYKKIYQKYLEKHKIKKGAFDLLCEITFENPTNKNIKILRKKYAKQNKAKSFSKFWENYIHNKGKVVPKVKIEFNNEILDLTQPNNKWIYIDVWGTWCGACRKELPDLQKFYMENESNNTQLEIYSCSYKSKNLSDFMAKHEYTFPVSEINKQVIDLFEITSYPTKILITPKGNYIKIPYGMDWVEAIQNYMLMEK